MPNMPFWPLGGVWAGASMSAPTGSASTGTPPSGFGWMLTWSLTFLAQVGLELHPVLDAQLFLAPLLDGLRPLGAPGLVGPVRRRHGPGQHDRHLPLGLALLQHLAAVRAERGGHDLLAHLEDRVDQHLRPR